MAAMASAAAGPESQQLLVVGPGVLGSYLGKLWLDAAGPGTVTGQTNSTANHAALQRLGIACRTKAAAAGSARFPYVLYAAPPSGSEDYEGDVKAALQLWDGAGAFVFTSSAGVYAVDDGSPSDEDSPVVPLGASERTDRLLLAEAAVLAAGGCVVRLVGLYHRERGPHTFFLKQGEVARWGGAVVNMLHYEDAASLCAAVLRGQGAGAEGGYRGRVFLGCDGAPMTFAAMMEAVVASGELPGGCTFTGAEGPSKGKLASNDATRRQLQWEPKYGSMDQFFGGGARDWYFAEGLAPAGAAHV